MKGVEHKNSNIQRDFEDLVQAARDGDRAALGDILNEVYSQIFAMALRIFRNKDDADNMCQDVAIAILTKIDQLQDPRCFRGWVASITRNMSLNQTTRHRPLPTLPEFIDLPCSQAGPQDAALRDESRAKVREGLDRLSTLDRNTLVAFYEDGHSLKDMARDFGCPTGTIKRRLHVARKRLAEHLAPTLV